MQAWILDESPGTYRFGEVPDPAVGPGDVRVRPVATALNHMDLWMTQGRPKPPLPQVPGCDVAGVVESTGSGVSGFSVGDEVVLNPSVAPLEMVIAHGDDAPMYPGFQILGEQRWGGHGELVTVPARNVVHRPAGRTWAECAAFPVAMVTGYRMLRRARLRAGERVLIVGIGGGVSLGTLAVAKAMGAVVYATSRDPRKCEQALALGAAAAVRTDEPWSLQAEVVVDSVGPATWDQSIKALVPGGRLAICGGTSGQVVELNLPRLFFKQHEIIGSTMGGYGEFAEVVRLVEQGHTVPVDQEFALADYPAALARLASGEQLGKVVLRHD